MFVDVGSVLPVLKSQDNVKLTRRTVSNLFGVENCFLGYSLQKTHRSTESDFWYDSSFSSVLQQVSPFTAGV